ncbi:MAG: hypothetical protein Unbinned706contig1000_6 [Prokaryotic dsDNA virus sp.]|nr:MAG: hypothetical protein Unbinned706contig1000_6 [Prokaryotic dsDNA virus sp.]|tara:strand:+ start:8244 stop:8675 length:432 start_codon:yes stop_codon:yes gene_type:complete
MPARGRSNKTIIIEAMRSKTVSSLLSLGKEPTKEQVEIAFFENISKIAFSPEDPNKGMCLKLLADKGWASVKPSSEMISFDFDEGAEPHVQASQVMAAAARGQIPPDIANTFINSIKSMIDIEEFTNLKERIIALEKALNGSD